jgi:diguanylate cyclase (GGDEF)-like protein
VNFEPEPFEDRDRPDRWTGEGGPESLRSLMFHSNDDLPWPARDLDDSDAAPEPVESAEPAEFVEPTGSPEEPAETPAPGAFALEDGQVWEAAPFESDPAEPDPAAWPADPDGAPEDVMDQTTQPDETGAAGRLTEHNVSAWPAAPSGWSDTITSTDGPHYWDRLMSSERDRVRRYHRPATIVFIEIAHLDRLSELWGEDVAAQSLVRVGRTVMRQIRSSDHAARIDVSRFAVFLPETDEIAAINFVERVRAAIEASLGSMAETVSLAFGWASPADGNFDAALELAESRLAAELAAEA